MKRKLVLLLTTLMCISLCACGGSESASGNNDLETKTEENSVIPSQQTEETEDKKETLSIDDIDRDNLKQYYDTTQFSGNPTLCYGIYYKFKNGSASFEVCTLSGEGMGGIEMEPIEDLVDSHRYFCIMTDNSNTPDNISDDTLAYIFTTPIE